jgi:hypothetical protein
MSPKSQIHEPKEFYPRCPHLQNHTTGWMCMNRAREVDYNHYVSVNHCRLCPDQRPKTDTKEAKEDTPLATMKFRIKILPVKSGPIDGFLKKEVE